MTSEQNRANWLQLLTVMTQGPSCALKTPAGPDERVVVAIARWVLPQQQGFKPAVRRDHQAAIEQGPLDVAALACFLAPGQGGQNGLNMNTCRRKDAPRPR